jgi:hypothetical protein
VDDGINAGDAAGVIHERLKAVRDAIGAAEFYDLADVDPVLDGLCRAAFVIEFSSQLGLDGQYRSKAAAALTFLVANGWARVVFAGYDGSTGIWNGAVDVLVDRAEAEGRHHADWYKEDRNRYGDRRWG